MKIAMLGAGATGSVFASYLRLGGAEVYLVDPYRAHMEAVAARGMLFHTPEGDRVVEGFHTSVSAEGLGVMDAVIVLTKCNYTEAALSAALGCLGPHTVVMSLQNGLGNVEQLAKYAPLERILYGSGNIGTELPAPGECRALPTEGVQLHFGVLRHNAVTDKAGAELLGLFRAGGCRADLDEDIGFFVWRKAAANSAANALMGLLRLNAGDMFANSHARSIFLNILRECADVATAAGLDGERIFELCRDPVLGSMRDYLSSTAQDMLIYRRKTEIDSLNGAISALGRRYGVTTPYNDFVTDMVKAIEENYDRQYFDLKKEA